MWDDFIDLKEELYNTFTFFNELPVHDHQPDLGHYNYFWKSTNLDMGHIHFYTSVDFSTLKAMTKTLLNFFF